MTIEEKLQHFYEVAVGEAKKEADGQVEALRSDLERQFQDHRDMKLAQSAQDIRSEIAHAHREVNKALSAEQLVLKRNWSRRQDDLKEKLFAEVKKKLEVFMASPAYLPFLTEQVKEAGALADGEELHIYVARSDASLIPELSAATGYTIEIGKEAFLGGIQAIIPGKNILIDHSFLHSFDNLRREFIFDGGLHYE